MAAISWQPEAVGEAAEVGEEAEVPLPVLEVRRPVLEVPLLALEVRPPVLEVHPPELEVLLLALEVRPPALESPVLRSRGEAEVSALGVLSQAVQRRP